MVGPLWYRTNEPWLNAKHHDWIPCQYRLRASAQPKEGFTMATSFNNPPPPNEGKRKILAWVSAAVLLAVIAIIALPHTRRLADPPAMDTSTPARVGAPSPSTITPAATTPDAGSTLPTPG